MLIVTLEGQVAFYKTATTNHTNNMTYPVPPRTALIGKIGAALGLSYEEAMAKFWDREFLKTSFRWITRTRIQPVAVNQIVYESGFDKLRPVFDRSGIYQRTVDTYHIITPAEGNRLVAKWYIVSPHEEKIMRALEKPYYPVCFGKAHMLATVKNIEQVEAEPVSGEITTKTCAPTDDVFVMGAIIARMPSYASGYRLGEGFENIAVPIEDEITIVPKYGAYHVKGEYVAVM